MNEELLTLPQVKQTLNIGMTRTYALLNEGKLKAVKLGGRTMVTRSALTEFIGSLPGYSDAA